MKESAMETLIVVFVTLIFGFILFNIINNKKFSISSFILLFIIGIIYFLKARYNDIYLKIFESVDNHEKSILIFCSISLVISFVEYLICFRKKNKSNIDKREIKEENKVSLENKDLNIIDDLMVYLEMLDEPLACLTDNCFLINNKMKKILKFNNYVIEKKQFYSFIHSEDKNNFFNNEGVVNFRLNINSEYEWFEGSFATIKERNYCLIRKCDYKNNKKIVFKTFKELINVIHSYEIDNKDYFLVFFNIVNYSDYISFYGKDFTNLIVSKHLNYVNELPYVNDMNLFYISKNEYVLLLDNLMEYNIILSELENNSSILTKNDIIISDNKICVRGKVGIIASSNVKNKNASNVVNKGFEMVKLASNKDFALDYAIYHEIDEEIDYSIKDLEIDLNFDFTKYKKRIQ